MSRLYRTHFPISETEWAWERENLMFPFSFLNVKFCNFTTIWFRNEINSTSILYHSQIKLILSIFCYNNIILSVPLLFSSIMNWEHSFYIIQNIAQEFFTTYIQKKDRYNLPELWKLILSIKYSLAIGICWFCTMGSPIMDWKKKSWGMAVHTLINISTLKAETEESWVWN
jgi:hypothetical protein